MPKAASHVRRVRSQTLNDKKRVTIAKPKAKPAIAPKKAVVKKTKAPAPKLVPTGRTAKVSRAEKKPPFEPLEFPPGVLLGAHTSTAGGLATAIDRAHHLRLHRRAALRQKQQAVVRAQAGGRRGEGLPRRPREFGHPLLRPQLLPHQSRQFSIPKCSRLR